MRRRPPRRALPPPPKPRRIARAGLILGKGEATLLDLVDSLLEKGVMVDGELVLGVADVDLVYIRLAALLAAVDAVLRK